MFAVTYTKVDTRQTGICKISSLMDRNPHSCRIFTRQQSTRDAGHVIQSGWVPHHFSNASTLRYQLACSDLPGLFVSLGNSNKRATTISVFKDNSICSLSKMGVLNTFPFRMIIIVSHALPRISTYSLFHIKEQRKYTWRLNRAHQASEMLL